VDIEYPYIITIQGMDMGGLKRLISGMALCVSANLQKIIKVSKQQRMNCTRLKFPEKNFEGNCTWGIRPKR